MRVTRFLNQYQQPSSKANDYYQGTEPIQITDRHRNGQEKKTKRTKNDLQNTTQKSEDRTTRTPLKTGVEIRCYGRVGSSCSMCGTSRVTLITNPVINHE